MKICIIITNTFTTFVFHMNLGQPLPLEAFLSYTRFRKEFAGRIGWFLQPRCHYPTIYVKALKEHKALNLTSVESVVSSYMLALRCQ